MFHLILFIRKFKTTDVPGNVSKGAPGFCSVYVISKGKISSVRSASGPPPPKHPIQTQMQSTASNMSDTVETPFKSSLAPRVRERSPYTLQGLQEDMEIKSPFTRRGGIAKYEPSIPDSDISFVSSGRPSIDHTFPAIYDAFETGMTPRLSNAFETGMTPRLSNGSDYEYRSFGSLYSGNKSIDASSQYNFSSTSQESGNTSWSSSQNMDDMEAEMRRLRLELKQTMDMYSSACREALTAKQKARELHHWKLEEQQRSEGARLAEEAALQLVAKERFKCKAAIEAAESSQRIAELELQKRLNAEMIAQKEFQERNKALASIANSDLRYRKYTIEEIEAATDEFSNSLKIGEGGYGPVYKSYLDHTPVAIKVLRPDAAHGRSQFQQEVEVLSCIRHPNMVLLLGACPEYGCLVYEYMANGSLEDCLFHRGNSPPLSWQLRFRIAAEIGTGLLFLHQTKPEPLVHRDLKPGNILLDRNYVSKISDVGLARLVPPSIANTVTQYRMTSTAGTFCYIDPEYQQTGMLGIKSDIYSLGILLLQIITAKPPMGLTHHVERAIEKGTFAEMLDPAVLDWPIEEAMNFAKLSLRCAELRRKDRPDLGAVILPELNRLRELAEENMPSVMPGGSTGSSPYHSQFSSVQDVITANYNLDMIAQEATQAHHLEEEDEGRLKNTLL
ncbi:PREDICTED: U-box domain-containing protein 34-like [Populus euphratica]|uniref:RING-type E3 ubiquitin transferase n=1 Tax=Populus euphratica TaxID=75702 RepID=A0AAJ6TZ09_POPEU|nr:PREDICTED: U-box domain-containing protein 34-like [Populus euphratica]